MPYKNCIRRGPPKGLPVAITPVIRALQDEDTPYIKAKLMLKEAEQQRIRMVKEAELQALKVKQQAEKDKQRAEKNAARREARRALQDSKRSEAITTMEYMQRKKRVDKINIAESRLASAVWTLGDNSTSTEHKESVRQLVPVLTQELKMYQASQPDQHNVDVLRIIKVTDEQDSWGFHFEWPDVYLEHVHHIVYMHKSNADFNTLKQFEFQVERWLANQKIQSAYEITRRDGSYACPRDDDENSLVCIRPTYSALEGEQIYISRFHFVTNKVSRKNNTARMHTMATSSRVSEPDYITIEDDQDEQPAEPECIIIEDDEDEIINKDNDVMLNITQSNETEEEAAEYLQDLDRQLDEITGGDWSVFDEEIEQIFYNNQLVL